jgi:hypothetical protein
MSRDPTTRPPPFDPEQYAKDSEMKLRAVSDVMPARRATTKLAAAMDAVPLRKSDAEDAGWFELGPDSARLLEVIDGKSTLRELGAKLGMSDTDVMQTALELASIGLVEF